MALNKERTKSEITKQEMIQVINTEEFTEPLYDRAGR